MMKTWKSEKSKTTAGIIELKDEGSGMETDQTNQLDTLSNQSAKMLNKNHDTEEMDTSTTSKHDIRFPSPFDIQTEIVMAEKRY